MAYGILCLLTLPSLLPTLTLSPNQILYIDSFHLVSSSREVQNEHVQGCIRWLRNHPVYSGSFLVYICENAPGSRGGEMANECKGWSNSVSMAEFGADSRAGVPKDQVSTQIMTRRMLIALVEDGIAFASDMFTHSDRTPEAMKQILINQMLAFRYDEKKRKLSGKVGASGRDDLLVATMMIMYWQEQFEKDPRYREYRVRANSMIPNVSVMMGPEPTLPGTKRNYVTDIDLMGGQSSLSDNPRKRTVRQMGRA